MLFSSTGISDAELIQSSIRAVLLNRKHWKLAGSSVSFLPNLYIMQVLICFLMSVRSLMCYSMLAGPQAFSFPFKLVRVLVYW